MAGTAPEVKAQAESDPRWWGRRDRRRLHPVPACPTRRRGRTSRHLGPGCGADMGSPRRFRVGSTRYRPRVAHKRGEMPGRRGPRIGSSTHVLTFSRLVGPMTLIARPVRHPRRRWVPRRTGPPHTLSSSSMANPWRGSFQLSQQGGPVDQGSGRGRGSAPLRASRSSCPAARTGTPSQRRSVQQVTGPESGDRAEPL